MTHSMTGFGKAAAVLDGSEISVEISAVNHRFLDCSVRLPYAWSSLEHGVRDMVKKHAARGKLSVVVSRKKGENPCQSIQFDRDVAGQYVVASQELGEMLGGDVALSPDVLAQLEGVFYQAEPEEDLEKIEEAVMSAVGGALVKLTEVRKVEGKALGDEIRNRVAGIRTLVASVEERLPELTGAYETRLRARITELLEDVAVAEERIAVEVAIMADKGDVTEEVVRLKAHLDRAEEMLTVEEPIGRELNFLSQEIQREVNTLGSKVRDTGVVGDVMRMKSELEKIREQVQNIE